MFSLFVAALLVAGTVQGAPSSLDEQQDFEAADDGDYDDEESVDSLAKKPTFSSVAQHFRVRLGDAVRLPCEVDELGPGYTLLWKREEGDILTAGPLLIAKDSRISHEGSSLVIRNISLADQGTYICQISTQDRRELRHVIEILGETLLSLSLSSSCPPKCPFSSSSTTIFLLLKKERKINGFK